MAKDFSVASDPNAPSSEDALLLIEVSDTTLDYDLQEKVRAYGLAGIAEVWIVNLKGGRPMGATGFAATGSCP